MKKGLMIGAAVLAMFVGGLLWLAAGASPDNAPQDIKTIDVDNDVTR